jgi:uncharacterized membrane protein YadS
VLGWAVTARVWTDLSKALAPISPAYAGLSGVASLLLTYIFLLVLTTIGAISLGSRPLRFAAAFTAVFGLSYLCWILGSLAYIAATPDRLAALRIGWSLKLTSEAGFIVALLAGLTIGNFLPAVARALDDAIRPEWYIKTAVVLLGGFFGVSAAAQLGLAKAVLFRGLCAIIEAYLIYWGLVYFVARRYFRFPREWAAPLASGISICGVSAAIATGAAIRARPIVPVMVSSLVVIFAVVELLVLPFIAQHFLYHEPLVAAAWMGLSVKTDGAAVASGAIAESLIRAQALATSGVRYQEGWIVNTAAAVKVFIDIFIGVWAFVLAVIWSAKIEPRDGDHVRAIEIWQRFPKFVLGYVATFLLVLGLAVIAPALRPALSSAMAEANVFRGVFFVMTFFSIGVASNFKRLAREGIGRLALVYIVCLFGFIIWIGLAISWLFFHGARPPAAS